MQTLFREAFLAGRLCLHPTDTVPGLTADPSDQRAFDQIAGFKQRPSDKPLLGLVPDVSRALKYWQPLPGVWQDVLQHLWPAPLSVIWSASEFAPGTMVSETGNIGLRVPRLHRQNHWLYEVLLGLETPLPTTSVNESGQDFAQDWIQARSIIAKVRGSKQAQSKVDVFDPYAFVHPTGSDGNSATAHGRSGDASRPRPSTLIQLNEDGSFRLLREGSLPEAALHDALDQAKKRALAPTHG